MPKTNHLTPTSAAESATHPGKRVELFTDGSCDTRTGEGGWAYLIRYRQTEKTDAGYEANTTNNRMELTAAVYALERLKEPCIVTLVTDSQYLKNAFTQEWLTAWQRNGWLTASKQPVKNKDLWLRLLELSAHHTLHWAWTRGHAGHKDNELVDRLALNARKTQGRVS